MRILKANTAVRLVVGPLCDKTTGLAKTGMTVTNMAMNMWHEHDDGSAPTKSIDAVSFTASGGNNDMVEMAGGYYDIEITATQLNITAGRCSFLIYDDDVILPYFEEWLVVPANVFNSIMGTDKLDVNAVDAALEATLGEVKAKTDLITTGTSLTIVSQVEGSTITVPRGDTLHAQITGLGSLADCVKLWFTVKADESDPDSAALIQIEKTDGLLYLNGAAATVPANGSLTIDDVAAGNVTAELAAVEMAKLSPRKYYYDIQIQRSTGIGVSTLTSESFVVSADYTRAVA